MGLNAKNAPGGSGMSIPVMEAGTYPARVVQIVDLGLQAQSPFQGKEKEPAYSIAITYEFVDEFLVDEEGNEVKDKPRWLTETMPLYSLGAERAKSTKRYNALDPEGVFEGDFTQLINMPCMVTVVHNPSKKNPDRPYENIGSVEAMRKKDQDRCAELINDPVVFDLDEPNLEAFNKLPKWIQEKVKNNLEYEGSALQALLKEAGDSSPAPQKEDEDDGEVENPY